MLCPACNTELKMSERSGIEIDYCPSCRGVWLDRGELDKIIERNAAQPQMAPPPPRQPQQPQQPVSRSWNDDRGGYGGHQQPYKKRKKSFLEELFD